MSYLAQIILLAQGKGNRGWMQILIFVGMAMFYIFAGVMRKINESKVDLGEDQEHPDQGIQTPAQTISRLAGLVQEQLQQNPQSIELPKSLPSLSYSQPDIEDERLAIQPVMETKLVSGPLVDLTDPDELTRAILHYEILGKPVSLREASEHIIGLRPPIV